MPNPDGTPTEDEMRRVFGNLASAAQANQNANPTSLVDTTQGTHMGLSPTGDFRNSPTLRTQDQLFGDLSQQQAANQAAALRANEYTAFQNQRLSAANAAGGVAGQTVQGDQGYGALGLEGAKYQTDTSLKGTQLNDASSQAWADRQNAALQQGMGAEMGGQTQGLNIQSTALAGRESQWASANQTHGIDTGNATQAGIADANRQQAYIAGGINAAGTVMGALSDEREKTNITPLGGMMAGNGVKPLASQAPQVAAAPIPSKADADAAQRSATGAAAGGIAGSVAGGALGSLAGPVGSMVGGAVGNMAGKALGKVFSDIRSKTNVRPLSYAGPRYFPGDNLNLPAPDRPALDTDAFSQLSSLADKYGAAGVAGDQKSAAQYAKADPKKVERRFARDNSHPILSEGDALLADSARNAPGSAYEYKEPTAPGAKPGTQVGPMAQDLAAHPVTRGIVDKDPQTGKLFVDGSRAALTGLAQNHAQQNHIDELSARINELEDMLPAALKRKKGDERPTEFRPSQSFGGL